MHAFSFLALDLLAAVPSPIGHNSMMAASPFTEYTAGAVVYVLIIAFLVITLLGGAFLVVNLGMMSKRETDRTGHRDPSDVGILKDRVWPREVTPIPHLPAEESEEELQREMARLQDKIARRAARRRAG